MLTCIPGHGYPAPFLRALRSFLRHSLLRNSLNEHHYDAFQGLLRPGA
jgi:hypothetical protein